MDLAPGLDAYVAALLSVRARRQLHPDAAQPHDGHEEGLEVARAGAGEAVELDGLLRPFVTSPGLWMRALRVLCKCMRFFCWQC